MEPALPDGLLSVAEKPPTWMGDSIKISLSYAKPFWREEQLSGTIFSNVGPIPEMYDHSDYADEKFALKGFFNSTYYSLTREERLEMALKQLEKYFGPIVRDYLEYSEAVWANEPLTYVPYASHVLPHQNNGHPVYQQTYLGGRFFVAGTETATVTPGYMEGAVRSAQFVVQALKNF
jgi:monoamine oxidase